MGAELLVANLLRVAAEDLAGARHLSGIGNRNAIYLCSQAAEKIIRAVLTAEGKHAGIQHHLNRMVDQVPDGNPLKPSLRGIEILGAFATTYRYPTAAGRVKPAPPKSEFDVYADAVARALDEAVVAFRVDLSRPDRPAGSAAPPR